MEDNEQMLYYTYVKDLAEVGREGFKLSMCPIEDAEKLPGEWGEFVRADDSTGYEIKCKVLDKKIVLLIVTTNEENILNEWRNSMLNSALSLYKCISQSFIRELPEVFGINEEE